jgi:hypothetical protein
MTGICVPPVVGWRLRANAVRRVKLPSRNKKTSVFLNFMISSIRFVIGDPPVENGSELRFQLREAFPGREGAANVAWDSNHSGKKHLTAGDEINAHLKNMPSWSAIHHDLSSLVSGYGKRRF